MSDAGIRPWLVKRLRGTVVQDAWVRSRYARPRLRTVVAHNRRVVGSTLSWWVHSREESNFTYDLTDLNLDQLAWFVAHVTSSPVELVQRHLDELRDDEELAAHLRAAGRSPLLRGRADPVARYGRRAGWYAIVRALRPALVVETGVDKGLGTCVLAAAVRRNALEGHPGRVLAVDIDPAAGALLHGVFAEPVDLVIADSLDVLRSLDREVGVFIHDSNHTARHEASEYELVAPRLSAASVVLSDNAHVTPELSAFARRSGRRFLYFDESPARHWYAGAGIGAAFR